MIHRASLKLNSYHATGYW